VTFPADSPVVAIPTPPPAIYTLSLHDALPILPEWRRRSRANRCKGPAAIRGSGTSGNEKDAEKGDEWKTWCSSYKGQITSEDKQIEEHTSELQSRENLVCRLLLEKKNIIDRLT